MSSANIKANPIPSLTVEEEDAIIHARITNDERPLRRVIKKFHNYASVAHEPIVPVPDSASTSRTAVEDAREAFMVELESFHLSLKKSVMICEAEVRQVGEYLREKQRIEDENGKLLGQIEQLKTALDHEQTIRRRKIEYDLVAEKVNALPNREELVQAIQTLESDIESIRTEHDRQSRTIQGQKSALDAIVSDLASLRFLGKDNVVSCLASPAVTPAADGNMDITDEAGAENASATESGPANGVVGESGELNEENKLSMDHNMLSSSDQIPNHAHTNHITREDKVEDNDIEMGELAEDPRDNSKGKRKVREEELEEGEASDSSSSLSEPPDD